MQENKERLARAGKEQDKTKQDVNRQDGAASSSLDKGVQAHKQLKGRSKEQARRSMSHISKLLCGSNSSSSSANVGAIAQQYPLLG